MSRLFVVEVVDSVDFLCPSIVCLNPPYSKNVLTNVGQSFLKIIHEEFPADHPLHKIFNRNTVKISYSCMLNIKQTIDGHNKSTLSTTSTTKSLDLCSCPKNKKVLCTLSNKCITESVIYQAIQSLLRTKLPIDLPKHMSALLKTRSKQDLQTTKHHLTLLTNGTLLNLANTCGN